MRAAKTLEGLVKQIEQGQGLEQQAEDHFQVCFELGKPLHMAFVDLRRAYGSVTRDALWRVLRVYGVDKKLVELLEDLHTGT